MTGLPEFIVLGVPKSGSTAVFKWLEAHPNVFVPTLKEPGFFSIVGGRARPSAGPFDKGYFESCIADWTSYRALFPSPAGTMGGEASVIYSLDPMAPSRIVARLPDVKIVLILRDPVDRAFSQFAHHLRDGLETTDDFATAINLEPQRRAEGWSLFHDYTGGSRYRDLLARVDGAFRPENVHIMLHDDILSDPGAAYDGLCTFLGVSTGHRPDFTARVNVSTGRAGGARFPLLRRLMQRPGPLLARLYKSVPLSLRRPLRRFLDRANERPAAVLDPILAGRLAQDFAADIAAVEARLGRDLSRWHRKSLRHAA